MNSQVSSSLDLAPKLPSPRGARLHCLPSQLYSRNLIRFQSGVGGTEEPQLFLRTIDWPRYPIWQPFIYCIQGLRSHRLYIVEWKRLKVLPLSKPFGSRYSLGLILSSHTSLRLIYLFYAGAIVQYAGTLCHFIIIWTLRYLSSPSMQTGHQSRCWVYPAARIASCSRTSGNFYRSHHISLST